MPTNYHTVIVAVSLAAGGIIGAFAIFYVAILSVPYSGHNTPPPACPEENCNVFWFNDGYYELRGSAYDRYLQKCSGGTGCSWVTVNGSNYMLTDDAYRAYLNTDNIGIPLYTISFESRYLPSDVPYLITFDGPTSKVQSLAVQYNVTKGYSKIDHDDVISFNGWVSKNNLIRFLSENDVDSLAAQQISVYRVQGYTVGNETVSRVEFSLPKEDVLNQGIEEYRNAATSEIVNGKTGVLKLKSEEFFPLRVS